MNKLRLLLSLLAIVAPVYVYSSEITSGEHKSFTRIFISEVDSEKYSISSNGSTIKIFTGLDATASTNRFWDKIGNDKVQEVSSSEGEIELKLNCECTAYYSSYGSGVFVDIYSTDEEIETTIYQDKVATSKIHDEIDSQQDTEIYRPTNIQLPLPSSDQTFPSSYISVFLESGPTNRPELQISEKIYGNLSCPGDEFLEIFTRQHNHISRNTSGKMTSRELISEYHFRTAQAHILKGMAVEALAHLRSIPDKNDWSKNLSLIAHTTVGTQKIDLSYWRDCTPGAQFWQALSAKEIGKISTSEMNQILSYYYSMPITLRSTIDDRWMDILSNSENQIDLGAFKDIQGNVTAGKIYRLDAPQIIEAMSSTGIEPDMIENISDISEKFLYFSEGSEIFSQIVNARIDMNIQNENFNYAYEDIRKYNEQISENISGKIENIINGAIENNDHNLVIQIYYEMEMPKMSRQTEEKISGILDQYGLLAETRHVVSNYRYPLEPETTVDNNEIVANLSSAMRAIQEANTVEMKIQNEILTDSPL